MEDWLAFMMILLGMVCSGIASFILSTGKITLGEQLKPARGVPPGDGMLLSDTHIVILRGNEEDVNAVTKGKLRLKLKGGGCTLLLCAFLVSLQVALQLVFMPFASQSPQGSVEISLGAKGLIEVELVCSTAKWGRGSKDDIHSSYKAELDSAVWRLVKALSTLVSEDGNDPAIDGWFEHVKPLTDRQKQIIADKVASTNEADVKKLLGVQHWVRDLSYREALERLASQPTVNIEGMYAGYTGPGGKTLLPSKAVAKLDFRLVPDQTADEAKTKLLAHLEKRGYGDIEVKVTGGYNPTQTDENSSLIKASMAVYKSEGLPVSLSPRLAGSWPGYIFTGPPVSLPGGHFGTGHGSRAHAPDEYYVIESSNPAVRGMAEATLSYVRHLYALAGS